MLKFVAFTLALAALGSSAQAGQKWPTSIVGSWNTVANQSSLAITVASQSPTGKCRQITGTILDETTNVTDNLLGYYCPNSGRFAFTRTSSNGATYQFYKGNLSDAGTTLYLGGTFNEIATPTAVGEYAFLGG